MIDDKGTAVICDFGLSRVKHDFSRTLTVENTSEKLRFLAPELLAALLDETPGTRRVVRPTEATDIYALGMTFLELGTFEPPFSNIRSAERAADRVLAGERPFKPDTLGGLGKREFDTVWHCIQNMWKQAPEERCQLRSVHALLCRR